MAKITKKRLAELVREAYRYGYSHNLSTGVMGGRCPLCREFVACQDYSYGPDRTRRNTNQILKAGMTDHLENYCSECPDCYELRGEHTADCAGAVR